MPVTLYTMALAYFALPEYYVSTRCNSILSFHWSGDIAVRCDQHAQVVEPNLPAFDVLAVFMFAGHSAAPHSLQM